MQKTYPDAVKLCLIERHRRRLIRDWLEQIYIPLIFKKILNENEREQQQERRRYLDVVVQQLDSTSE